MKLDLNINTQANTEKTLFKLPKCTSYSYWTDCGYEYDCKSKHEEGCDNCLCTYKTTGGLYNPETGKKVFKIIALLKYGFVNHHLANISTWASDAAYPRARHVRVLMAIARRFR